MSTEIAISTSGWSRRRRTCEATQPTTAPTAMPPSTIPANSSVAEPSAKLAAPTAPSATWSALSPVPSLTRLSPSRIALTRSGAPSPRMIEVAATGSVGPSAAPSTKAISHGSPATKWAATATRDRGGQHQAHRQEDHRAGHEPDVLRGEAERRRVEDHRQEDQEDQLGRDLHVGRERDQPDDQPAEHQRDGVGHPALLRRHGQQHHRREQQDEEVDLTHRTPVLVGAGHTSV